MSLEKKNINRSIKSNDRQKRQNHTPLKLQGSDPKMGRLKMRDMKMSPKLCQI